MPIMTIPPDNTALLLEMGAEPVLGGRRMKDWTPIPVKDVDGSDLEPWKSAFVDRAETVAGVPVDDPNFIEEFWRGQSKRARNGANGGMVEFWIPDDRKSD